MAVANAWGLRNTVPTPPLQPPPQPSSSLPNHSRHLCFEKESNLSCVGLSINRPISRNTRNHNFSCRCSSNTSSSTDWDWNRWTRHFSEIEQAESFASVLKFQLEEAVEKEDFQEAGKLKAAIAEATSKDTVAEIMWQLKNAVDEERYRDASKLCKLTGSGLVGWWVGCSKDSDDPFGRIVWITPGVGRFVARSYTPRQLVTASSGIPLFEIFVVKEADQTYSMQVVFLQRAKGSSTDPKTPPSKPIDISLISNSENSSVGEIQGKEETMTEGSEEKNVDIKDGSDIMDPSEEGIKSVIKFLKDKIPGLKVKVTNSSAPEEITDDRDSMEQLAQEDDEKTSSTDNSDDADSQDDHQEEVQLGGGTNAIDAEKNVATKLVIGGLLHNREDTPSKEDYVRFPAKIQDMERDSFELRIPERGLDTDFEEIKMPKVKVAALAAQGVSELMPHDIAKAFWGVDKGSSKVSRDVQEIIKLAVTKRNRLSESTSFSRITTSKDSLDPFDGLYVGAFGPFGTEVVQLKRKFGHWSGVNDTDGYSDVGFYEYVEAVKLTGDLNVPAGQVTFRAKIGKGNRIQNRGKYPDDLGVVAGYKGQGRMADFGFRNPRWVEGELLQLSGKGMWPYIGGADMGLLYVVPEKSFLVLLNRLKLPE